MRLLLVAVLAVPVVALIVLMQDSGTSLFGSGSTSLESLEDGPGDALTGTSGEGDGSNGGVATAATPTPAGAEPAASPTPTSTATPTPTAVASVDGSPFGGNDFVRALADEGVEAERGSETNRCEGDADGAGVEYRLDGPGSASGTVYLWVYADAQERDQHWVTGGAPTPRDSSCPHAGSYWNQNVVLQSGGVTSAALQQALRAAILSLDDD